MNQYGKAGSVWKSTFLTQRFPDRLYGKASLLPNTGNMQTICKNLPSSFFPFCGVQWQNNDRSDCASFTLKLYPHMQQPVRSVIETARSIPSGRDLCSDKRNQNRSLCSPAPTTVSFEQDRNPDRISWRRRSKAETASVSR